MDIELEAEWHWQRSDGRYYRCSLQQNLFQEWVTIRQWGTLHSRYGRSIERLCRDYEDGVEEMAAIARRLNGCFAESA